MELYFVRHGEAFGVDEAGVDSDAQRPLTEAGLAASRRVGEALRRLGVRLDVIAASPLKRARQTADAIGEAMGAKERVVVTDTLRPGCTLTSLADFVRTHRSAARVALVGHEPDVSELVCELVGGASVRFGKAAVARVDLDEICPGGGTLELLAQAEVVAALVEPPEQAAGLARKGE